MYFYGINVVILRSWMVIVSSTVSGQLYRQQFYAATKTAGGNACALDVPTQTIKVARASCTLQCMKLGSKCISLNIVNASSDATCQLFESHPVYYGRISDCTAYEVRNHFFETPD
jgi:hypothetical protein